MSGASAAGTLVEIRIRALERNPDRGGRRLSDQEKEEIRASIQASYDQQTDCRYAAARLWVDAILDPAKTREAVLLALESAAHNPVIERFHPGVLQT
jgi:acetyl-CoA carboxylase carboxyltransferase component